MDFMWHEMYSVVMNRKVPIYAPYITALIADVALDALAGRRVTVFSSVSLLVKKGLLLREMIMRKRSYMLEIHTTLSFAPALMLFIEGSPVTPDQGGATNFGVFSRTCSVCSKTCTRNSGSRA